MGSDLQDTMLSSGCDGVSYFPVGAGLLHKVFGAVTGSCGASGEKARSVNIFQLVVNTTLTDRL
jgi:hypothetical protein